MEQAHSRTEDPKKPQLHPVEKDGPLFQLPSTIQIFPGNSRDKVGFVFEFDLANFELLAPDFKSRLALYKKVLGFNGEQMDQKAGLSVGSVARFIRGQNVPTWESIVKLAKVIGITPNELLWGVKSSLADRITQIRKRKELSQSGLARSAGLKQQFVNELERGHVLFPSEKKLVSISKALSVGLEQLCPGGIPWKR